MSGLTISDICSIADIAHENDALPPVDNTTLRKNAIIYNAPVLSERISDKTEGIFYII